MSRLSIQLAFIHNPDLINNPPQPVLRTDIHTSGIVDIKGVGIEALPDHVADDHRGRRAIAEEHLCDLGGIEVVVSRELAQDVELLERDAQWYQSALLVAAPGEKCKAQMSHYRGGPG